MDNLGFLSGSFFLQHWPERQSSKLTYRYVYLYISRTLNTYLILFTAGILSLVYLAFAFFCLFCSWFCHLESGDVLCFKGLKGENDLSAIKRKLTTCFLQWSDNLESFACLTSDSAFGWFLLCRRCSLYLFAIINFLTGSNTSWLGCSALYLVLLLSCQTSSQNCMHWEPSIWLPHLLWPQTSRFSSFRNWFSQILFIWVKEQDGFFSFTQ